MALKKQILVVEDNQINRELLKTILDEQYTVIEAENGLEGLQILQKYKDDIALVLLDVMMPVMDGYTFLSQVKKDSELALIPVIVTTQKESEADEIAALEHGATDFVPKPYRPQIILHRVASLINLRENAAMVNQFRYDALTGLYSKEFFYKRAQELIHQHPERCYTIVCSNLENFKLYNDVFGVSAGNRLLNEVADMYRNLAEKDEICGRFNADRFMILRSQDKKTVDFEHFVQAGQELCERRNAVIKWGIYEVVDPSVSVEKMCDRALLAADSIKGQYNAHYAVYDDTLRSKLLREQVITESMETALKEKQFQVYFQPKFSLMDDQLAGAEALIRWIHPEMGFLSPGEFIPLFEKNGFITQLDKYVWEQSCALLHDWKERGMNLVPVSVNVSRADIYQENITQTLLELIKKYELDPAMLHLEITESAYTETPDQIISTVSELREEGFLIEMDDFGSGYSSLNMLNQMKVDILKLDMKFIQSQTSKPMEQGILHFIVELARWMNLSVVAEGVETREQLERIRAIGCDYVQGYFFAKPMPSSDFESYLIEEPSQKPTEQRELSVPGHFLLVVDEDAAYRKYVCDALCGEYQILEADSTETALACMTEHEKDEEFALLLSMTLPMQGAETILKTIESNPRLWRMPVLATMPQDEALEKQALELDVDDFIKKPHTQQGLRKRLMQMARFSAHQERERMLQDEASRDYLTGLLNRRGLHAAIEALHQDDLPLALYIFDLDDLKKVNDGYGHEKGDELLTKFGEHLRKNTRNGDILCRYGGDEFIVVLRCMNDKDIVQKKGMEICRDIESLQLSDGFQASCSAGAVLCEPGEKPGAELIERADKALYRAKQMGKGICALWEE